jgi:hypothetical protein
MKTHGDPGWETFPSYLDILVPRVLEILRRRSLTISFFVVGQDAALDRNRDALRAIASDGHEIANHSFHHEPWLHLLSRERLDSELAQAEEQIEQATGHHPVGFRGPGFSCSKTTLEVLAARGYRYDASTLPTFIGPLARAYYFLTSRLSREEREKRNALFGTIREGLRSLKPYRWHTSAGDLIEIPVTTMPLFRVPIHASYILYLSTISQVAAMDYLRLGLILCRLTGTTPSYLLHPLDFLDADDAADLVFFPAMRLPKTKKLDIMEAILDLLTDHFTLVPMHEHHRRATTLPLRVHHPAFVRPR